MNKQSTTMPTLALCALLGSCGGGDNQSTSPARVTASDKASLCQSGGGIEGTGRQKLTGRITGITVSEANTIVSVGSTGFDAGGASVLQGTAPASLSDLRVDQIITALADRDSAGDLCASNIFILDNGATDQLPFVQLGTVWAPFEGGYWGLLDGPFYSVLPQAQVLVDGDRVNVTGLNFDWGEIVLLGGQISFPAAYNPGGLLASSAVTITHMVDGPVDAIDLPHGRIVVLGQTVFGTNQINVGATTTTAETIKVGDRVSVSGHPTASGPIIATRIALSANTGDFLVSGVVQAANPAQHVLTLNGVAIDYGTALLSGAPAGGPTDGERIMVRAVRPANGEVLTATSIADDSIIPGAGIGTVVAMHGIVTQVYSSSLVAVDGYPIRITDSALKTCGTTPPVNSDVMLQGVIGTDGTIVADIYCHGLGTPTAPGLVQGTIQAIDPNYGTISILGFSAQPSPITRVTDSNGSVLSLGDLKVGDAIALDGAYLSFPGLIEALGVLRIPGGAQSLVTAGPYHISFADPIFYVAGNPIATDSSTTYSMANGSGLFNRAVFFEGPSHWPYWDKFCEPIVSVAVRINPDGSLTALSVEEWSPIPEGGC